MREQPGRRRACRSGTTTVKAIVEQLYPDLVEELVPMAEGTVWAHLLKLKAEGKRAGQVAVADAGLPA